MLSGKKEKMDEAFAKLGMNGRPVIATSAVDLSVKMCKAFVQNKEDIVKNNTIIRNCYEKR